MISKVIRILLTVVFAVVGAFLTPYLLATVTQLTHVTFPLIIWTYLIITVVSGLIGYLVAPWLIKQGWQLTSRVEGRLAKMPIQDILAGTLGLIVGLLIAYLLGGTLARIPVVGSFLAILFSVVLGYLGFRVAVKKREDMISFFANFPRFGGREKGAKGEAKIQPQYKVLDTSVIIDGRIADICSSGFIEGTLLIPRFVLEELQHIADSSDLLKRNRGRRGLDILNRIQKEMGMLVQIYDKDFDDVPEVDSKLVRLAKLLNAKVLTNDYNLNKVAELQGVTVLNINELANAVKPVVLPGEEMVVHVIKDGKETGQGVAYLDDGTMIVVDGGRRHIGETIDVMVTSVLQTAAGRMIFAKPKAM